MKKNKKNLGCVIVSCIIISIVLLCCIIYVSLGLYWTYTDFLGTERYRKRNLNYIKGQSDFFFRIPENDIGITCSKRKGAEFYVMFSKDSIQLSDSVDYLKYKTEDMSEIKLIFDPHNISNVYIRETQYLKEVHSVHYNLQILESSDFEFQFLEVGPNLVPKCPYILVGMATSTFAIFIMKHDVYDIIREGDIHGGW